MENIISGQIREGDWVSGTTIRDERFIGFVQSVTLEGILEIQVTQSDREDLAGKLVEAKSNKVRRMKEAALVRADEVYSLIDLALQTRDEEWFAELTANAEPAPVSGETKVRRAANRLNPRFIR